MSFTGVQGAKGGHNRASKPFVPEDFKDTHPGREEEACEHYNKTLYLGNKKNTADSTKSPWAMMKGAIKGGSSQTKHGEVEMNDGGGEMAGRGEGVEKK